MDFPLRSRVRAVLRMNPAELAITIGKHLSNNLYISYLYGIQSATQTIGLTYRLAAHCKHCARRYQLSRW
ncbi:MULTISPECIES: hypothetical protein [unclassified Snodgrassella]|uniref:hypothetical protein n=1 Tax=unclassified Snodgrassella TaxID=2625236 RepID=UPI0018DBDCA8|nr:MULTISPECIES: hypothetical protein [unclassified Snodgrassella]MBI0067147.1 hypothetical protein [Snodgrassella sp. M0110]MBI0078448.1 hypothetical protein [Snodgrassella sp. M0112]